MQIACRAMDDPPIKMQAKQRCAAARIWTYIRDERPWGGNDPPAAWYRCSTDREDNHPADHLKASKGWMHADAYSEFKQLYKWLNWNPFRPDALA